MHLGKSVDSASPIVGLWLTQWWWGHALWGQVAPLAVCPSLCPSHHREVNYGCFLTDCASGDGEKYFLSPVLLGHPCPSISNVVFGKLHICISSFQWILDVKITFTTGWYSIKNENVNPGSIVCVKELYNLHNPLFLLTWTWILFWLFEIMKIWGMYLLLRTYF